MTACGSNYASAGSTPKPATYGGIMPSRSSTHSTLRGSANLESSPSSQQGAYSLINTETQSLSNFDQMGSGGGNPSSPPAHSKTRPPLNITTPPSASASSFMSPSPLSNDKVSDDAQGSTKATTSFLAVPDKFKILIQCLKSHRSKGSLRPLRSLIGLEIGHNGTTYQQAGVLKFREYVEMAKKAGIVELGGSDGTSWVALRAPWYDVPLS